MLKTNNHGCQDPCPECDIGPFTRNYYFTGKLLVERDFRQEQAYHVDKLRHHHQRLHGWGVVCGLKVVQHDVCRDRFVCIEPGTAIDCCGHEIVVREKDCIDIAQLDAIKALKKNNDTAPHTLQVCIRYHECETEQIPVLYDECGCDDTRCAPNRILESYAVDIVLDPVAPAPSPMVPTLDRTGTIIVQRAAQVALHEGAAGRLYVLTDETPGEVHQINTSNGAPIGLRVLPDKGTAIAVSNDGTRVYVVVGTGAAKRQLVVVDTATPALPDARPPIDIPGSAGGDVELVVAPAPDNRLFTLVRTNGHLLVWGNDIDTPVNPAPVPKVDIAMGVASALVVNHDGSKAYALDTPAATILAADIATAAMLPAIAVLPAGSKPSAAALARAGGADQLAVADNSAKQVFLVDLTTPKLLGQTAVGHPPVGLVVSADGDWAYVLEVEAGDSFIQAVDLGALRQTRPPQNGAPIEVGAGGGEPVLSASGGTLYVPFTGTAPTDGSVAVFTVTERACCDLLWQSLDGCPECDTANCVVLATIENYKLGFAIDDQTSPPADPAKDLAASIARIDNRKGRRLLPSTSTMAQAIECLCESSGGGKGPKGDPGTNGANGNNGVGFNPDQPKILDVAWVHGGTIPWNQFFQSSFYSVNPDEVFAAPHPFPLLTVYFNRAAMKNIGRQTFQVSIEFPQLAIGSQGVAAFTGLYNVMPVRLYGYPLEVPPPMGNTPHTTEPAASAWSFVPDRNFFTHPLSLNLFNQFWLAFLATQQTGNPLDLPCLHVVLKGDFIWAGPAFKDAMMLDGNNIGGQVGVMPRTRDPILLGGKNPSGDLAEGGAFESWFFLSPPTNTSFPNGLSTNPFFAMLGVAPGLNLNTVTPEEMRQLPGATDAIVKRILRERDKGRFTGLDDFQQRIKLPDDVLAQWQGKVFFE